MSEPALSPGLRPYIEAYYFTPANAAGIGKGFPAVSTGYLKVSASSVVLVGQTTSAVAADVGLEAGFGLKLRAGAIPMLFGLPAYEVTNQVIRLEDILGPVADSLVAELAEASTLSKKWQCLERRLMHLINRHTDKDYRAERQAIELLCHDSTPISRLAKDLGYSSRQLQRKLNDFLGFSPRLFKRLARFEKALSLMQATPLATSVKWADLALACGYSDQAHFIREFRHFSSQTPTAYMAALRSSNST